MKRFPGYRHETPATGAAGLKEILLYLPVKRGDALVQSLAESARQNTAAYLRQKGCSEGEIAWTAKAYDDFMRDRITAAQHLKQQGLGPREIALLAREYDKCLKGCRRDQTLIAT